MQPLDTDLLWKQDDGWYLYGDIDSNLHVYIPEDAIEFALDLLFQGQGNYLCTFHFDDEDDFDTYP